MSIFLNSTSLLQVQTAATVTIKAYVAYVDLNGTTVTPAPQVTSVTANGATTICAAPSSPAIRNIKYISLYNAGSTQSTFQVFVNDGTVLPLQFNTTSFPAGAVIQYQDGYGFVMLNAVGAIVQSANVSGAYIKSTLIQTGTTTFTTSASTNRITAELVGSGGSGGGCPTTSGEHGSGGGAGGYAFWDVAVSPNTAYTCAVGASKTGTSAANGTAGAITTLAVGATTVTAQGGTAGLVGNSITVPVAGGAQSAISTNGTVNGAGAAGDSSQPGAGVGNGGGGGSSQYGAGGGPRTTAGAGNAAVGFGGGGGGAWTSGSAAAGGTSGAGMILIREFT